ncbi:MAG: toll/interleukin-1 receptor domain-containing protein [Solobacterium sp.]|nr:toll/interleukin-1 receptor domain-containing protein [Solobacterium sp.]
MTEIERKYKAFISYRHKPNDMKTAKAVHQLIEHYRIPAEIAEKHGIPDRRFGRVFRDQDELPLSDDLSSNITQALDASEYLIVICTPDLPQSAWCRREITYFLEHNPRSHVLAVLADGTPETSFPDSLTHVYDPDTNEVTELIEPLAANICGASGPDMKLLNKEIFRLYAAMIPCAFDDLWQRERRYQTRRRIIAGSLAGCLLLGYTGTVVYKNHQIQTAYDELEIEHRNTQKKESEALAALSVSALTSGDRTSALKYASEALPYQSDRPYVPAAEKAVNEALYLYRTPDLRFDRAFDYDVIPNYIDTDGEHIFFAGNDKRIYCIDGSGKQQWKTDPDDYSFGYIRVLKDAGKIFAGNIGSAVLLDSETGSMDYQIRGTYLGISDDASLACIEQKKNLVFIDTLTGKHVFSAALSDVTDHTVANAFDCTFSTDNRICLLSFRAYDDTSTGEYEAMTFKADLTDQTLSVFRSLPYHTDDYEITDIKSVFRNSGSIFLFTIAYSDDHVLTMTEGYYPDGTVSFSRIDDPDILPSGPSTGAFLEGGYYLTSVDYFTAVWKKYAILFDMKTGELIDYDLMESDCLDAFAYTKDRWHYLFENGTVKIVYPETFANSILEFHDVFSGGFDLLGGFLFNGSGYEMAVIPANDPKRMEFLNVIGDTPEKSIPWLIDQKSSLPSSSDFEISEDGQWYLQYIESYDKGTYFQLHLLDSSHQEVLTNTYPETLYIEPVFDEDKMYLFGDHEYIWDYKTNELSMADAEIPYEYDYIRSKRVCGNVVVYELAKNTEDQHKGLRVGYAVRNVPKQEWTLVGYEAGEEVERYLESYYEGDIYTADEEHFYMLGSDHILHICPLNDEGEEKEVPFETDDVHRTICEDDLILIEDHSAALTLINVGTGETLFRKNLDAVSSGLRMWVAEDKVVISESGAYGNGYILDRNSGEELCTVPKLVGYDRAARRLVCYDSGTKSYLLYKMLNTEEAAERASMIISSDE